MTDIKFNNADTLYICHMKWKHKKYIDKEKTYHIKYHIYTPNTTHSMAGHYTTVTSLTTLVRESMTYFP